jgi:D-3-phosphoglycerate dehydrogenase
MTADMKILFADSCHNSCVDRLRESGHTCLEMPELGTAELGDNLDDVDVLVVRSTEVDAATIEASRSLSLVVRAGAGVNTIDVDAASARGVAVANTPGRNAIAVAELTMALLLALDRQVASSVIDLRAGHWDKKRYSKAQGIFGRTIGIIGLGEIGLAVADRAHAFGMDIVAVAKADRSEKTQERISALGMRLVPDLVALVSESDVVSVHVPGGAATSGMLDAELLGHFREGAFLLNTSRGEVMDEAALLGAIESKGLLVGLDVYPDEPSSGVAEFESELARHPSVVGTHHIGASTVQAQESIAAGVADVIEGFAAGDMKGLVNLESERLGTRTVVVRHYDRVGVLAATLSILRRDDLNVQQMENLVFVGSVAAVAIIDLSDEPSPEALAELSNLDDVLHVAVREVR